jgi:hypothetical protein
VAEVLAREAAADDINGNSVSGKSVGCEFSDVIVNRHLWPVLGQYFAGEGFDLAKGDSFAQTRPFKAKAEAANPAEQVKEF